MHIIISSLLFFAYRCSYPSCVSKFSSEKALQTHISCHSKNRNLKEFHCIHCDEKFVRWGNVCHVWTLLFQSISFAAILYIMLLCRWRLCSAHLWRVHKVDVDLLACPVCLTYKAATPLKLEIHMRTHGDLRPFRCTLCPKSFKQSAQLRNHCAGVHLDKNSNDATPRWLVLLQMICDFHHSLL